MFTVYIYILTCRFRSIPSLKDNFSILCCISMVRKNNGDKKYTAWKRFEANCFIRFQDVVMQKEERGEEVKDMGPWEKVHGRCFY